MHLNIVLVSYFVLSATTICFTLFTVILAEDKFCQTLYTSNYGYSHFYHLPNSSFSENGMIFFNFSVMTVSDAHLLLSQNPFPSALEPVYEIIIGGGKNTFIEIRRLRRANTKTSVKKINLLSPEEMRLFWIKIENGNITVGKNGEDNSFLYWKDTEPIVPKYVSFSSWFGVQGKWSFDCKGSTEVKKNITGTEKLSNDFLSNYDPYTIPISKNTSIIIESALSINYLDLDIKKSAVAIMGEFQFTWYDEKLQWDPSKYDNLTFLHLQHRRIWQPDFVLLNAADERSFPMNKIWAVVSYSGKVQWSPPTNLISHCSLDLSEWPWDSHICDIKLGLFANQDLIEILVHSVKLENEKSGSKWEITLVEPTTNQKHADIDSEDLKMHQKSALVLTVIFKRRTQTYNLLLFIPLFVIMGTSLCSFWTSPLIYERVLLQCASILLLIMFMLTTDLDLPNSSKSTPYLLVIYSRVLIMTALSTISSLWVISIVKKTNLSPPPKLVCKFLRTPAIRAICSSLWTDQNNRVTEDETFGSSINQEITTIGYWQMVANIIDITTFYGTATGFVIILSY